MVFSSAVFLFLFLPVVLIINFFIPRSKVKLQNLFLFLVSSFFYFYSEQKNILLLYFVIFLNYACGLLVYSGCTKETLQLEVGDGDKSVLKEDLLKPKTVAQKLCMTGCVIICIGFLWYFKYINFTFDILSRIFYGRELPHIKDVTLPLGISFYTFHVLSYSLDVYFGQMRVEKNLLNFASYVLMFPQLVAGPIVRYRDIFRQFYHRVVTGAGFINGSRRFCFGLAKKVLIANTLAEYVDQIFVISPVQLSTSDCWAGAVAYTLQIYFDFGGYSDMAIGLAMLFGFHYKENFNYPYLAKSAAEFWHRWHISLSTWLRDYVYIHLGGNRGSKIKTCCNILFVFLCSGLWHGANSTFVYWGLLYGCFIVLESLGLKKILQNVAVLAHFYLLLIAITGWVIFRADNMNYACAYIMNMYGFGNAGITDIAFTQEIAKNIVAALIAGIVLSYDWRPLYKKLVVGFARNRNAHNAMHFHRVFAAAKFAGYLIAVALFVLSSASIISSSHNPFIYFRF